MTRRQSSNSVFDQTAISRRTCVKGAFAAAVGVPMLAGSPFSATAATSTTARVSKELASYQDQPKGKSAMCSLCKYFAAPASCAVVLGTISPQGWCQRFDKRSDKT